MKQEPEGNLNDTVFERAFIKKETEEDKERFTRVLRGGERERSPHSDEGEDSDKNFKRSKNTPYVNRYCRICNFTYNTRRLYLRHKIQIHNNGILPDIDTESLHCNTCNLTVTRLRSYRQHMLDFHSIKIPLIAPRHHPLLGPDNFCVTCKRKFSSKRRYRYHLTVSRLHNRPPRTNNQSNFDFTDFHCKICDKKYTEKDFLAHMKTFHNTCLSPPKKPEEPNVKVNVKDPNNYCAKCEITYSRRDRYLRHLTRAHLKSIPELLEGVECNGIDNVGIDCEYLYCTECNRVFLTRKLYRFHMENAHNKTINSKRQLKMPCIFPNSLDPNSYCSPCNMTCSDQSEYRSHLKDYHGISVKNRINKRFAASHTEDPVIDYDINYCNACNMNFSLRYGYRKHLTRAHGIPLPLSSRKFPLNSGTLNINESRLRCTTCNKTYSSQLNYRSHLKEVHHVRDSHDKIMSDRESGNYNIQIQDT